MDMTPERWRATCAYLGGVFGPLGEPIDGQLATLRQRAAAAGLPDIAVSPDVGRLLMLLASMAGPDGAGARLAVELGTLGGYSALWIARGLAPGGRLVTVEPEAKHADFAQGEFERAGMAARIELRRGLGAETLARLLAEHGPGSFDFVFLDAVKSEYATYAALASRLLRTGGLLVADNCLGSRWWITDAPDADPTAERDREAMDRFNRWLAGPTSGFLCACIANREGLAVARRVAPPGTP
ncbi:MAG: O-methyltransferase [Phycisphaerales bacterium]|nr:O-methyltransferase [Phycisphaerales bacterium]